ncbi:hypothetical protein Tco_0494232 [Tanacetum coccineum]
MGAVRSTKRNSLIGSDKSHNDVVEIQDQEASEEFSDMNGEIAGRGECALGRAAEEIKGAKSKSLSNPLKLDGIQLGISP